MLKFKMIKLRSCGTIVSSFLVGGKWDGFCYKKPNIGTAVIVEVMKEVRVLVTIYCKGEIGTQLRV